MMLKNKTILLTGAGRGIGREIAMTCAREGAKMILISRTENELEETLQLIIKESPESFYLTADISNESEIAECFLKIKSRCKRIDVLINNAGIQHPIGLFHQNDFVLWKKNIEVNLFGAAWLTHLVLPDLLTAGKGKIINLSGGGSTGPRPNFSAYAVSKTAIVRFTENLAEEYKDHHIDVNAISPGAVNTRMLEEVLAADSMAGSEFRDALQRKEKGGTDPSIAARLISFLASDRSDGITGKLISAPWDPWQDDGFQELLRTDKNLATLRRIDNKTYYRKA